MTMREVLKQRRAAALGGVLVAVVLVWTVGGQRLEHLWAVGLLLHSSAPSEQFFNELANKSRDPAKFLQQSWDTGKVAQRRLVAMFLADKAREPRPWLAKTDPLVLDGTRDPDASVRELALATLQTRRNPQLSQAAAAQLRDVDPLLRLLGLDYLRQGEAKTGVRLLIPLLDDPDPRVVASTEVTLSHWSGTDYGVRLRTALMGDATEAGGKTDTLRLGVEKRKAWWLQHAAEYPPVPPPETTLPVLASVSPSVDFVLTDLASNRVRLSDFRGHPVLLNFWATWCTACVAELSNLVELQKKIGGQAAIIGVALDGVPTEDEPPSNAGRVEKHDVLRAVRDKVARVATSRGLNYKVLLDPKNSVGSQFDGGELPATIILDSQGRVRRRFIGERSVAVLQAMLAEASQP